MSLIKLPSYYKIVKFLGSGAYGYVVEAHDMRQQKEKRVAIKKISDVMKNLQDAKRCLREVALMQVLNHENIVQLIDFIVPEDLNNFKDLYIVLAFKETDLFKIINSKQQLTTEHIQYFMYQIFRGLVFIHSAGILHRDLKPANLLLDSDCGLQICDFGLARLSAEKSEFQSQLMTEYVSTRYYRSPEILLTSRTYSQNVDVFAAGCILAELINRRVLFPGNDYINQLNLEIQVLGKPQKEYIDKIENISARQHVQQMPDIKPMDIKRVCPNGTPEALDLLKKCLEFDGDKRISALQAMQHPFFVDLYDSEDVIKYKGKPITLFFENYPLTKELIQIGFLNCCAKFHNEIQDYVNKKAQQYGYVL